MRSNETCSERTGFSLFACGKMTPMPDTTEPREQATTFLLAEHARLCELYLSTRETAERRVTLFLTLPPTNLETPARPVCQGAVFFSA